MLEKSNGIILSCLATGCNFTQDARLLLNVLEAIEDFLALDNIMGWVRTDRSIAYNFERAGGLDALEEVQRHQNPQIY